MSCNPLTPDSQKYIVKSPLASPGAFRWIRPNVRDEPTAASPNGIGDVNFVNRPALQLKRLSGAVIHTGTDNLKQNPPFGKWNHISIEVNGELMPDAEEDAPTASEVQSRGNLASILKGRITLGMGTARERTFDFDIGAGVEFDVAAYHVQRIEALIPDPQEGASFDPPYLVDGIPEAAPALQLATVLTTTCYFTCGSGRQHNPLTYTVPVLMDANNPQYLIPRQRDSVRITGGVDEFTAAAGGAVIDFIYVPSQLSQVIRGAAATFPPFFVLDQVALPISSTRFPEVVIPNNCNAFRISRTFAGDDTLANIVQVLNV
ncbi:MAG: hypothetical protein K0U16_07220 [Gammaproteobacteria bacterium]|nr:hypothetical protein [Gammaproteobacteria bacterium]